MQICYLSTTFPRPSETFLQREVRTLRRLGAELEIHSIYGGAEQFEGLPIERFRLWRLSLLVAWIPYWMIRRPAPFLGTLWFMIRHRPPSKLNLQETLLGFGYALCMARHFERNPPQWTHAVWATMPATAALGLHRLIGNAYSMGAHAYDLFQDGGDWFLQDKLRTAAFVHTSTEVGRNQLVARGADFERVVVIRRGLERLPEFRGHAGRIKGPRLQLLSVGRLVPKKGFSWLLELFRLLRDAGIDFEAKIIGEGPLRPQLTDFLERHELQGRVAMPGHLDEEQLSECYRRADVFLFAGEVAGDGDRDGLPNVIPEAMAWGLPVVSSPVGGVQEVVLHDKTGWILEREDPGCWIHWIRSFQENPAMVGKHVQRARLWVEENFDARKNSGMLLEVFARHAGKIQS